MPVSRLFRNGLIALSGLLISHVCAAGQIYSDFADVSPDPDQHYLFYSHGYIVQGDNPKPEHPRWGVYDFPADVEALAQTDYQVIAYHRPKGSVPMDYAKILAGQVKALIDAGVPNEQIALVGFSQGGRITGYASHLLADTPVNTVILAGCWDWVLEEPEIKLNGPFLSIHEVSDRVGSCTTLVARSPGISGFDEIAINTGLEHGAFYRPIPEWVKPVQEWLQAKVRR